MLVIKDKNDNAFEDEGELPTFDLDQVTQSRKKKKMRIDGSSTGLNKKTIFDDDGEEISEHIFTSDEERKKSRDAEENIHEDLATANDDYMRRVKDRLNETSEQDKVEEKERIREKHRKRKLLEKAVLNEDDDGENEEFNVTLASSESDSSDDTDSESVSSSNDSKSNEEENLKEQENLALSLIRNSH